MMGLLSMTDLERSFSEEGYGYLGWDADKKYCDNGDLRDDGLMNYGEVEDMGTLLILLYL